jgi:hypothetical protein
LWLSVFHRRIKNQLINCVVAIYIQNIAIGHEYSLLVLISLLLMYSGDFLLLLASLASFEYFFSAHHCCFLLWNVLLVNLLIIASFVLSFYRASSKTKISALFLLALSLEHLSCGNAVLMFCVSLSLNYIASHTQHSTAFRVKTLSGNAYITVHIMIV